MLKLSAKLRKLVIANGGQGEEHQVLTVVLERQVAEYKEEGSGKLEAGISRWGYWISVAQESMSALSAEDFMIFCIYYYSCLE